MARPQQRVIIYRHGIVKSDHDAKMASNQRYQIKKSGKPPRVCPECGRKFPVGKTDKPQAHRYPSPNQWMNCPGIPT